MQSKEEAQRVADTTAARLGAGWVAQAHENLGWHASVKHERRGLYVAINWTYPNGEPYTYSAFITDPMSHYQCVGTWAESGSTPEEALAKTLAQADAATEEYVRAVNNAREIIEPVSKFTWKVVQRVP